MSQRTSSSPIIVQKYGGTSLSSVEAFERVAKRVVDAKRRGNGVVVVVSAMNHTTDELLDLARRLNPNPPSRELDVLLGTGECVSMALLSMAIENLGESAVSLTGAQCGIFTNRVHMNARILEIRPQRIVRELSLGRIVVVAGFQGVNDGGDLTTLGRGGSDTSAVALAASLGAEFCEVFTDVDGVFSADPRVVDRAKMVDLLSAEEMEELAWLGAQVLKAEAVEFANSNSVSLHVRSSFSEREGTRVAPEGTGVYRPKRPDVAGVAGRRDLIRIRIDGSRFMGDLRREIFEDIASFDLVFGGMNLGCGDFELLISSSEIPSVESFSRDFEKRFAGAARVDGLLGSVSLVGFGLGSRPASFVDVIEILESLGVVVLGSFTGRESVSFVVPLDEVDEAMRVLHRHFVERVEQTICSA